MSTLTKENKSLLVDQLSEALVKFSDKKMSFSIAKKVADIALKNIDFSNSTLSHKGINWYAKDLLKKIRY
ncbi:hypothetical protein GCM10023310_72210 [Paenibacillus vulneris]|uniref:Uncharacterized protein n=1 Tax=Paenibacillus vulneris TaxID=1133364 RepID=A0ABW3UIU6_9BACL